ncbi:MAG TPA: type 1 glutamine amidotransferase [Bryobacteraceae bacterium]|nr:type 1 glutamine amidotransferase [Bryobacteraceae bacterium]
MRVLAFRHVPFEGAGRIETVLASRGISLEYVDLCRPGAPPPDASTADALIFLGGPMSVNDPLPHLRREMDLIVEAAGRNQPVLGVCLGAQLIAKACGARVYRNPLKEIGWFDILLTEAGAADPLFAGVRETETVFHWHGETFDLPAGAAWLARSERCRHQAFRIGDSIYGLQFHLEVNPAMIADWCLQDENCGDVRELDAPLDPAPNQDRLEALSGLVFGRWCDLL